MEGQLIINTNASGCYEFSYYKTCSVKGLDSESSEVIRFMDDAIDALMRRSKNIEVTDLNSVYPTRKIKLWTGSDAPSK